MARAIPPRVVVGDGASAMLCAQLGSTSNVTGTPSTGRPWASCTRTINSVDCVRSRTLPTKMPDTSQIVGSETSKEKRYPAPGVGPTSCGAQAVPPNVSMKHVKTKARRRTIRFSLAVFKRSQHLIVGSRVYLPHIEMGLPALIEHQRAKKEKRDSVS